MTGANIEVADQPLASFADVIGIAHNVAAIAQSTAIEGLNLGEAAEQIGGLTEIPGEAFVPDGYFFIEERFESVCRELLKFNQLRQRCVGKRRHANELYVYGRCHGSGWDFLSLQEVGDFLGRLTDPVIVLNEAKANKTLTQRSEADTRRDGDMGSCHQ